ncbi:MAG: 3-oxoacyl-[acyl-carrier-protein] reductase [candidate division Zixibacteria bacterium]|nr:3-oxoacyl-[acyl-carrier-protein] reductase [candidate division Zixibacteria bacterium]MDH3938489.1 3-oxoacyl-[acyl-carrier-protein] reductase [candidate division Zixibacteria bacterium]MDH4033564.1 3-oxoacyl-[acyl-carrier-protein] reductase [candidate division Zixibacteria bacterium]
MSFENKTAIVTGSGRGIGKVIVSQLAAAGANVVVSDIDQATCETTAGDIGASAIACQANVTKADDIDRLFKTASEKFESIDIVVNNAGITRDGLMIRMDEKDWDTVLDINLKGAFLVTKTAARIMMKQRRGRIVNISSVVGLTGNAGQANYSAAKAGLVALTKTAAKELGSRGITVNAVAPGFIETEMTAALPEAARASFLSNIVLGRAGTPSDVAAAVLFLASDEAAYITGQVLSIDGGMVMA